jgi:arylsulfatase A-like enzyme
MIASLFFISVISYGLCSDEAGIFLIPMDMKINDSAHGIDDRQVKPGDIGADVLTNRKNILSENSSLQKVVHEDIAPAPRPNIVIMLADNMAYMDPGCYGGGDVLGAPTPRMDQMAREGLRLTSFYSETQCTPTRAAMLTGRLPIRTGMNAATPPGIMAGLSPNETTLAKVLSDAGYSTAMFGKWHLGDVNESEPQNMGFDEFFGQLYYLNAYTQADRIGYDPKDRIGYDPKWEFGHPIYGLVEAKKGEDLKVVAPLNTSSAAFIDDQVVDRAITYIKNQTNTTKPFFVYLAFARPHFPDVQNPKWAGKSIKGPYGDAIMELDYHVGQVLDALREMGMDNDTIVVFASDNGPTSDQWPDTGYAPFRGEIGSAYEGGVRVPCIFRWPGKIEEGRTSNEIMCTLDFFSTFAALSGGKVPRDRPIDGIDQSDFLLGRQNNSSREWVVWYLGSDSSAIPQPAAIRWHQFKIHLKTYESYVEYEQLYGQRPAVYDLVRDPGEEHNIAGDHDFVDNAALKILVELVGSMRQYPNTPSRAFSSLGKMQKAKS